MTHDAFGLCVLPSSTRNATEICGQSALYLHHSRNRLLPGFKDNFLKNKIDFEDKPMKRKSIIAFLLLWLFHTSAFAQVSYDGCFDFIGAPVASVLDNSINDVAIAIIEGNTPVIRYSTSVLSQMSEPTRRFFYMHECAHHALGHTVNTPSIRNENEADCWAAKEMKNKMNLSLNELRSIQQDIAAMGRGDWTHLPGPKRAIEIDRCLSGSSPTIIPAGLPSGYDVQPCGCWGPNPPSFSPEPRCSSGTSQVVVCPAMCAPGHPAYARVCM